MIPDEVLEGIKDALKGLNFGRVNLEITVHDGNSKYRITRETSYVPGKTTSGQKKEKETIK
jgi:hypothetical protein